MARRIVGYALAGLLCLQAAPALGRTGPHFDIGVRLLKRFEYAEAIKAFQKALDWPGNTRNERATIHLNLGVAQSNLTDYDAAEASFKRALTEDPSVELPRHTSPKIKDLLERVRSELKPTRPVTPPPASRLVPTPESRPVTEPEEPRGTKRYMGTWPAWVTLGGAVVAASTGLALGIVSRSEKNQAEDKSVPYDEAVQHADNASSRGLGANIMFAVAGAAAITSGVLFYLGWRKHKEVSAAVVPSASGMVLQLGMRR